VHCDASRPGLNWANQNMQLNKLTDIRWVYEDAFKFAKREVKRGNQYHGIIMDPPPYGRGPEGERWNLQEQLDDFIRICSQLLEKKNCFFILSMYAVGLSSTIGVNVVKTYLDPEHIQAGELFLKSANNRDLPMGTFLRFRS
jgi:23S rRNA (cytosine1962-C5)-methyltransferase